MLLLMRQEERNVITELSGVQNTARSLTDTVRKCISSHLYTAQALTLTYPKKIRHGT